LPFENALGQLFAGGEDNPYWTIKKNNLYNDKVNRILLLMVNMILLHG
jgi:hypothetical protein